MENITDSEIIEVARTISKSIFTSTNAAADFESGFLEGAKWMKEQLELKWVSVTEHTDLDQTQYYYVTLKDASVVITKYLPWWWEDNVTDYAVIPQVNPYKR
jgi:hypothetical protein